ncbi:MAG: hypothetical protein K0Q95_2642 [Bacteroidota bacterium]|jgi:hypothetical protein|nr:hypothetical protein [Bacteroidota bacterium]
MKRFIRVTLVFVLFFSVSYRTSNKLSADNPFTIAAVDGSASGIIVSLNPGAKSGLLVDDVTGDVKQFHYAGLEVLEVNVDYVYIYQVTASGKIIIRDIRRK